MKKYILYARVANEQQGKEGQSLKDQVSSLQTYAKRNNLQIGEIISEAASGMSAERTGFNALLRELSTGKFEGIICRHIDRITRSSVYFFEILRFFQKKGLKIVTPNETYGYGQDDLLKLTISNALSTYYTRELSRRIKMGIAQAKLMGKKVFKNSM
jgi:DNA invertase Pin-like site-specific DNA recombinase